MPSTIAIGVPAAYPWVLAAAVFTPFLNFWQVSRVSGARRESGIKYPQLYATQEEAAKKPAAFRFNCHQRAHQNTLEYLPIFLVSLLITGLVAPRLAAISGALFHLGRIMYTLGYGTGEPKKRTPGAAVSYLGLLPLLFGSVYAVYQLLQQSKFQF